MGRHYRVLICPRCRHEIETALDAAYCVRGHDETKMLPEGEMEGQTAIPVPKPVAVVPQVCDWCGLSAVGYVVSVPGRWINKGGRRCWREPVRANVCRKHSTALGLEVHSLTRRK